MKREFFNCACHTEGIILEQDEEQPHDFYFALWSYGQSSGKLSFVQRIRWCWNILKTGLPWTDCVILDKEEAKKLGESILSKYEGTK